jgi:hypothetical protein
MRQIEYLHPHFDLTVLGHGEPHPDYVDKVKWLTALPITPTEASFKASMLRYANRTLLVSGKLIPASYHYMYWSQPAFKDALDKVLASGCDAILANEWNSLPIAIEAAKKLNARVVYDAHEYSPEEFQERYTWRTLMAPMIEYLLRKYAHQVDASTTVSPPLAQRYKKEFQIDPIIVMSAPRPVPLPEKEIDPKNIRLIYHGCGVRERQLEVMIKALAKCDERFTLTFMMTSYAEGYLEELQALAAQVTPGRLFISDPVAPEKVAAKISQYDMGFCYHRPLNFNYIAALPNKFFECIVAGLPVCVGPSPAMAELVRSYQMGCVASSFEPDDFAATLNRISADELARMRVAVREATKQINADVELGKVIELYQSLLSDGKQ